MFSFHFNTYNFINKYRVGHLTFGIWIGYKSNLWIFFQKYSLIRKIEPVHLRMKHNIIKMTATAGLTVPHSINPIFQYIFDCLGKRSISKIVTFGAQKIQTSSLRSRLVRILVRWHHWAIFLRKWARSRRYCQWRALPCHARRIFVSKNWRGWNGRHFVWTGRGHLPHSQRKNRSLVHCFRKSNNQPKFWCQLTASELWLDSVGLFFVGSR